MIATDTSDMTGLRLLHRTPMNEKEKTNPCDSFDVFLSHNSQDKPIVRQLAEKLNSRSLRVWFDEEQLVPGRPWQKALETVIETIGSAAVLIGKTGLGPWKEPEMWACLNEFVKRQLPVIPVLLPGAPAIPKLPLFLQAFTWVDLRDGLTDSGLEKLAWGITGNKSGQSSRPDKPPEGSGATLAALRTAILADAALPELDEKAIQAVKAHPPRHLEDYRLARIAEWSQPRYELNRRFTRLTLLLDQGPEAQGVRWQAQQSYDDLRKLLSEVSEPALVLLGPPGCGKSTLLRRLELDLAVEALRKPGEASLSLFLPLNRYRPVREGLPMPTPQEWLEQEWALRNPDRHLPAFAELLRGGRLVLLLDAVNEMPHADAEGYRNAIASWRGYLADLAVTAPGVRAVFSCRSLDYSASLSTPGFSVPHVRIERLDDAQVEEFLTLYNPGQGPGLWQALRGTPQLDLFRSPFYLKLLLAQASAEGAAPQGRSALFTGFVRQALIREVEAGNALFRPGLCLDPWDHERIVRREQMQGYELAEDSPLFPALSGFAHRLQEKRGARSADSRQTEGGTAMVRRGAAGKRTGGGCGLASVGYRWPGRAVCPPVVSRVFCRQGHRRRAGHWAGENRMGGKRDVAQPARDPASPRRFRPAAPCPRHRLGGDLSAGCRNVRSARCLHWRSGQGKPAAGRTLRGTSQRASNKKPSPPGRGQG